VLDERELLDRLNSDGDLLAEIADLYLTNVPEMLRHIRSVAGDRDGAALERGAHALAGMAANLCAADAEAAARRLERMGHDGDLSGLDETIATLEAEFASLTEAIAGLRINDAA
jgi:HPt (histidine-containing phosphotransfer) domain-containing protein